MQTLFGHCYGSRSHSSKQHSFEGVCSLAARNLPSCLKNAPLACIVRGLSRRGPNARTTDIALRHSSKCQQSHSGCQQEGPRGPVAAARLILAAGAARSALGFEHPLAGPRLTSALLA